MISERKMPGDRLRISADDYNAFAESAKAERASRFPGGALVRQIRRSQSLILVRNSTGSLRGQYQILGLNGVLNYGGYDSTDVKAKPVFDGIAPSDTYHKKNFCILQESLLPGAIGWACISGYSYVDLLPSVAADQYAGIINGDYYLQQHSTSGGADVLWVHNGVGSPTLPAIVRIPSTRILSGSVGARVYHSSNQTVIPSGLVLDFNSEDYDDASFHSGGSPKRLTVPESGRYAFGSQIEINLPSVNTNGFMTIRKGGTSDVAKCSGHESDYGGLLNLNCNMIMTLSAGDYLEVVVTHDDPMGNATINSTSGISPYFWIQRM